MNEYGLNSFVLFKTLKCIQCSIRNYQFYFKNYNNNKYKLEFFYIRKKFKSLDVFSTLTAIKVHRKKILIKILSFFI